MLIQNQQVHLFIYYQPMLVIFINMIDQIGEKLHQKDIQMVLNLKNRNK